MVDGLLGNWARHPLALGACQKEHCFPLPAASPSLTTLAGHFAQTADMRRPELRPAVELPILTHNARWSRRRSIAQAQAQFIYCRSDSPRIRGTPTEHRRLHSCHSQPRVFVHCGRNWKSEIAISSFPWIKNPNLPRVKSRPGSTKVSSTFHWPPTRTFCTRRSGVTSI